jgi:hypothetical protein
VFLAREMALGRVVWFERKHVVDCDVRLSFYESDTPSSSFDWFGPLNVLMPTRFCIDEWTEIHSLLFRGACSRSVWVASGECDCRG